MLFPNSVTEINDYAFPSCPNVTFIDSNMGDDDPTCYAFTYASQKKINYASPWVAAKAKHSRIIYLFKTGATTRITQMENHIYDDDTHKCSVCGAEDTRITITLKVTTYVEKCWIIYLLDSNEQPTSQFVFVGAGVNEIKFKVQDAETFAIQIYDSLYTSALIDGEKTMKKEYNLTVDTAIEIKISGVSDIYNWIMV